MVKYISFCYLLSCYLKISSVFVFELCFIFLFFFPTESECGGVGVGEDVKREIGNLR